MKTSMIRLSALVMVTALLGARPAPAAGPLGRMLRSLVRDPVGLMARGPQDVYPTRIRFIPENREAWYARWYALNKAEQTLDITYFNFLKDPFGMAVLGLIRKKAQEGVTIRLMVDSRGSLSLSTRFMAQAYLREIARYPNVTVKVFKPLFGKLLEIPRDLREVVASNHDKIVVVDGHLAIVGGRNLGEKYYTDPADDPDAYRDNDAMIEGEGVAGEITAAFEREFDNLGSAPIGEMVHGDRETVARDVELARMAMDAWLKGGELIDPESRPKPERRYLRKVNERLMSHPYLTHFEDFVADPWKDSGIYPARLLDKQGFGDPVNDITENLIAAIDATQHDLLIQNAYLVLTDRLEAAFKRASARGVKIRVLTNSPSSTSNLLVQAFFIRDWKRWLHEIPNLRVFITVSSHKIHAKTFVFDSEAAAVGSYNLDPMSETLNSEIVLKVEHPEFAQVVRQRLEEDIPGMVECKIRLDDEGNPVRVIGPEDYLHGISGFLIRILSHISFLRPLV